MSTETENARDIVFRIRRYDPGTDSEPYYEDFTVPVPHGMVVLDGLWYIKEKLDPSLAWRSSCRMGVCGSCAMLINGRPTLACNTQILDVVAGNILALAPLPNFDIIRDLAPELGPMFEKHMAMKPYIERADVPVDSDPPDQYWQSMEDLERILSLIAGEE